ncbi:uncharacterized protein LOC121935212 [Sceloporus undulatus]|uniref:uncharacterized protein LOC121935212 n=1 Tax=Sceloporus undulatus TaxID=8520 RepID=UPI001C4A9470|nr:uncharacterized protein LOC121935212 [Sceloporus undulatus]
MVMALIALVMVFFQLFWQSASADCPLFSVSPKQEIYRSGESINLTCSAVGNHRMSRIQFTNSKWFLYFPALPPSMANFTHALRISPQDSGMFSCIYYVEEPGQETIYLKSNAVRISVLDPLPPPTLRVDSPSRVVKEGDSLLITCSTDRNNTEKKFHFYKDEVEMTSNPEESPKLPKEPGDPSPEASVSILKAGPIHTGEFACRYEEKMSNGWTVSPLSRKVYLTVWAPSPCAPLPLPYVWMAIPFATAVVPVALLAFYCGRKKKDAPKGLEEFQPEEHKEDDYFTYVEMRHLDSPFDRAQTWQPTSFSPLAVTQPKSTSRVEKGPDAPVGEEGEEGLYKNIPFQRQSTQPETL